MSYSVNLRRSVRLSWEDAFGNQRFPMCYTIRGVDGKHRNCRASRRRYADKNRALPPKMLGPFLFSGMKERRQFLSVGIKAGDVWTLRTIASRTCQSKILFCSFALMLKCDDMINFERSACVTMRNQTILAHTLSASPNQAYERLVHPLFLMKGGPWPSKYPTVSQSADRYSFPPILQV